MNVAGVFIEQQARAKIIIFYFYSTKCSNVTAVYMYAVA